MSFATLKKNSNTLDRLSKEIEKLNGSSSSSADDRFWKPERDKSGNGSAVIRFLPEPEVDGSDALPFVRIFDHGFKGPTGKWYIENSLTTLNQKDPVSEFNSKLWNETEDENSWQRKQARDQKRRLHYISNILVISDTKNPSNEGKVFLFKYGKKIFDKVSMLMHPEFEGDIPVNPFDMWKGANFKLRIRTVEGYPNYDQSVFEAPLPLSNDDAYLEKIWKSEYSLKELVDPKNFKSYNDLKAKLDDVLGLNMMSSASTDKASRSFAQSAPIKDKAVKTNDTPPWVDSSDDDDDEIQAFKRLAM
jgi:hypothetical protein